MALSNSKSSQTNQYAAGSGQNVGNKSNISQGGSFQQVGKGSVYTSPFSSSISGKVGKNASINLDIGIDPGSVASMLTDMTTATAAQIAELNKANEARLKELADSQNATIAALAGSSSESLKALQDGNQSMFDKLAGLFGQKADNEAGNPRLIAGVSIFFVGALVLGGYFLFKRR